MPTYDYECQKCGHRFELVHSIKDAPKKSCPRPKCRGRVKRLLSTGGGLLFKGSGFYVTDYRKPSYKEAAQKDAGPATPAPAAKDSTAPTKSKSSAVTPKKD